MSEAYSLPYHRAPNGSGPISPVGPAPPRSLPPLNDPPKSSAPSKSKGIPKGKGAIRAKSGCYTCRIRRKKCDEQPDESGSCQTCIRLRLECLGFGAKRPDWMRENNSVPELREKIKQFLASQGMIKGHSGSGARNTSDGPAPILILSEGVSPVGHGGGSHHRPAASSAVSSPSSPQSPPSAITTNSHHGSYPHVVTSALRDLRDGPSHSHPRGSGSSDVYSPLSPDTDSPYAPHHSSSSATYTAHPPTNSHQSSLHTRGILHPTSGDTSFTSYAPQHMQADNSSSAQQQQYAGGGPGGGPFSNSTSSSSQIHPPPQQQHPMNSITHPYHLPPIQTPLTHPSRQDSTSSISSVSSALSSPSLTSPPGGGGAFSGRHYYPPPSSATSTASSTVRGTVGPIRQPSLGSIYGSRSYEEQYDEPDYMLQSPTHRIPPFHFQLEDPTEHEYIQYYMKEVVTKQYLMADANTMTFLLNLAQTNEASKNAMCLLSALHKRCMRLVNNTLVKTEDGQDELQAQMNMFYGRVKASLFDSEGSKSKGYSEGDAMAGLHVVSSFLFSGGRGPWPVYLDVACNWVAKTLGRFPSPREAFLKASDSERFIMRTTMWFDVWASVTSLTEPRFLHVYRELFGNGPISTDPSGMRGGGHHPPPDPLDRPAFSMITVVGCTNTCFRAMAEIATLANWKNQQVKSASLSMVRLVERGMQIESQWLPRTSAHHDASLYGGGGRYAGDKRMGPETQASMIETRRKIVADVFTASARVYLHMVLSKSFPECPEIKEGVDETIAHLRRISPSDSVNLRAVVRSVIFAICICGCLTQDEHHQQFFVTQLDSLGSEAEVFGNIKTVKALMEKVWELRARENIDVDWREVMKEEASETLLLV